MPVEVASLKATLGLDSRGFKQGIDDAKKGLQSFASESARMNASARDFMQNLDRQAAATARAGAAQKQAASLARELTAARARLAEQMAGEDRIAQNLAAKYNALTNAERAELAEVQRASAAHAAQQKAMDASGKASARLGQNLSQIGGKLTLGVTAPLLAMGAHAVQVFGETERGLNQFQQVTGATAAQMQQASKVAQQLGADISLPATSSADAVKAMNELGKAGISAADAMAAARPALQLAAAAGIDAGEAAKIAAQAMNAFHLQARQLPQVMDQLAAAANASTGEVKDFSQGFQQASAVFAQAGRSSSELVTSLALMSQAGVNASDAGTSLRVMLSRLAPTTKQAKDAMKALGVDAYDAQGRMKPLRQLVGEFTTGLARFNQEGKTKVLQAIFGQDAVRAAQIVLGSGTQAFDKMTAAVNKQGAAAAAAAAKNKGLLGAIDAMKSAFDTAASAAIEPVSKDLTDMAKNVGKLVGAFGDLPRPVRRAVVDFGGLAAITGPVVFGIGQVILSFKAIKQVLAAETVKKISLAFAEARLSVVAFGASLGLALGAAVAFFAAVASNFDGWRDSFVSGLKFIGDSFADFWENLKTVGGPAGFFSYLKESFTRGLAETGDIMQAGWIRLKAILTGQKDPGAAAYAQATGQKLPPAPAPPRPAAPRRPPVAPPTPAGGGGRGYNPPTGGTRETPLQREQTAYTNERAQAIARLAELEAGEGNIAAQVAARYRLLTAAQRADLTAKLERIKALQDEARDSERLASALDTERVKAAAAQAALKFGGELNRESVALDLVGHHWANLTKAQKAAVDSVIRYRKEAESATRVRQINQDLAKSYTDLELKLKALTGATEEERFAAEQGMHLATLSAEQRTKLNKDLELSRRYDTASRQKQDFDHLKDALSDVQLHYEGLTAATRAQRFAAEELGVHWGELSEDGRTLVEQIMTMTKNTDQLTRQKERLEGIARGTHDFFMNVFQDLSQHGFGGFFKSIVTNFKGVLQQMAQAYLASKLSDLIVGKADNSPGGGGKRSGGLLGAAGNLLGSILPGLFGGKGGGGGHPAAGGGGGGLLGAVGGLAGAIGGFFGPMKLGLPGLAVGGPMEADRPYLVGERGAELVVPRSSGTVIPHGAMAAAAPTTVVMNIHTPDVAGFRRNQNAIMADAHRQAERHRRRDGH